MCHSIMFVPNPYALPGPAFHDPLRVPVSRYMVEDTS